LPLSRDGDRERRGPRIAALALALVAVASAPAHGAGKRIVLLDFTGPGQAAAKAALVQHLRASHTVVPQARLAAEAKRLGLGLECTESNIIGVATAAAGEAAICGTITGRGAKRKLQLAVYNGGDGSPVQTFLIRLSAEGLDDSTMAQLAPKLEAALAKTWNWDAADKKKTARLEGEGTSGPNEPTPDGDLTPGAPPGGEAGTEDGDTENPVHLRKAQPRRAAVVHEETVTFEPRENPRLDGLHALRVGAGPSFMFQRSYAISGQPTTKDGQDWKTSPAVGFLLAAECFPGAWFSRGFASNIGLGLAYTRLFGITWSMVGQGQRSVTHQTLAVDARVRYRVLDKPITITPLVRLGYKLVQFAMNDEPSSPSPIPDVSYSSFTIGLGGDFGLLKKWLTVSLFFDLLPLLGRGEIATSQEYGPATGLGLAFGGALHGRVWGPVGWKIDFEYERFSVNFTHSVETRRWADKVRDRYINGLLYLTFVN
jgi:hypothetical protein